MSSTVSLVNAVQTVILDHTFASFTLRDTITIELCGKVTLGTANTASFHIDLCGSSAGFLTLNLVGDLSFYVRIVATVTARSGANTTILFSWFSLYGSAVAGGVEVDNDALAISTSATNGYLAIRGALSNAPPSYAGVEIYTGYMNQINA